MSEWKPIETAPRDGTRILAYLYSPPDDCGVPGFGEWREVYYRPYKSPILGWSMPWHAGNPDDSHSGEEPPDHFGEGVPIAWMPLPPKPEPPK